MKPQISSMNSTPRRSPALNLSRSNLDSGRSDPFSPSITLKSSDKAATPKASAQFNFLSRSPEILNNTLTQEFSELTIPDNFDGDESFTSTRTITISRENPMSGSRIISSSAEPSGFSSPSPFMRNHVRFVYIKNKRKKSRNNIIWQQLRQLNKKLESTSALVNKVNSENEILERRIGELEKENITLKEYVNDQLQIIPTDISIRPYGKSTSNGSYLLQWKNEPKCLVDVEKHEIELNGCVYTVKGHHHKAIISDPREEEKISIRTVNKSTGKLSDPISFTFNKENFKENKEIQ